MTGTGYIVGKVLAEAARAHELHGDDSMLTPAHESRRLPILVEEVGEVAEALINPTKDVHDLEQELVQVAAMAITWLHALHDAELDVLMRT